MYMLICEQVGKWVCGGGDGTRSEPSILCKYSFLEGLLLPLLYKMYLQSSTINESIAIELYSKIQKIQILLLARFFWRGTE